MKRIADTSILVRYITTDDENLLIKANDIISSGVEVFK